MVTWVSGGALLLTGVIIGPVTAVVGSGIAVVGAGLYVYGLVLSFKNKLCCSEKRKRRGRAI